MVMVYSKPVYNLFVLFCHQRRDGTQQVSFKIITVIPHIAGLVELKIELAAKVERLILWMLFAIDLPLS